ncbi:ferric reductase like transmembrane component-domain-containing protein [Fusarium solani]|uniref:Ferric reductase like transmembrane component-domain-containing protein n=1 Tax=Fusarium solani TaxID=169388 RepID=A0A9P9GJS7_FUSSL|nr:ferric reductase like transmembrane component-domain-containing protein [Fusarium solani]KAH7239822.1 ferric reductase like transmembrane component-domain-containing protein [Fusarium solani]
MRSLFSALALVSLSSVDVLAHVTTGRERYGVIGYGVVMYDPPCAFGCIDTVKGYTLDCKDDHGMGEHSSSMHMAAATPECKATNDPFLQTMAWCFHTHCTDEKNSTLENIWERDIVGRLKIQPTPKYSYQVALALAAKDPPTEVLDKEEVLNRTSLVDEDAWLANFNGDSGFEQMEILAERYGIVLMATCVTIPVVFSWLRFLPLPQSLVSKFYATVIDPPLFGRYHAVPVLGLGFVPTRGQGLFVAYIWIINIILSAVGYKVRDPMSWYGSLEQQLIAYISNRVGLLSFANLALAVLFSSRNNLLLFVTNWSHSTFLLIHRWIAVICMLQACLHSAIYLQFYLDPLTGEGAYAEESKLDYWVWGIVATLALVLLMPLSILPLRQKLYEAFLASHIVLALLSMIGCMLHIFYRYEWQWGYQTWIWITFAFWIFDRFLARPLRLMQNGVKRAIITVIDEDYLQIAIPRVEAEGHVYLYFPTLTWRFWENHPFSVAAVSSGPTYSQKAQPHNGSDNANEDEKKASILPSPGPYPTIDYPNIICVAGGVGVTGVLPCLDRSPSVMGLRGKKKLFWGVRTEPLVQAVRDIIAHVHHGEDEQENWNGFDVSISVGKRFDLDAVLKKELESVTDGTTVVVCGPSGMADDVRVAVTELGKGGCVVRLTEESFAW